jgi:hypothetical protein
MSQESERLAQLIARNQVIHYFTSRDKEHGEIRWNVYGAPASSEIIVVAEVKGEAFYEAGPSPLEHPPMVDRIFGIDVRDRDVADKLSNDIWERHGETMRALIRGH